MVILKINNNCVQNYKKYFYYSSSKFQYLSNIKLTAWFAWKKIHLVGLGYKNFVIDSQLYILLGNANYVVYRIPDDIYLICKKNQIFLFSYNIDRLNNFVYELRFIKKSNIYKGKGVVEFRNFKFMRLRIGKKQKFS